MTSNLGTTDLIAIVTTSHNQGNQVQELFLNLLSFCRTTTSFHGIPIVFIVTDSGDETSTLSSLASTYPDLFFLINVPHDHYWTGSVHRSLSWLNRQRDLNIKHVIVMNCDVIPSDWSFLINLSFPLESIPRYDSRSSSYLCGYNIRFHGLVHSYAKIDKVSLQNIFCFVVPTRLIIFNASLLDISVKYLSRIRLLMPHYGADYLLTSYLSSYTGSLWRISSDSFITEDFSTSGFKKLTPFNFRQLRYSLLSIKSTYNLRSNFIFPWLASIMRSGPFARFLYVCFYYSRYFARVLFSFLGLSQRVR